MKSRKNTIVGADDFTLTKAPSNKLGKLLLLSMHPHVPNRFYVELKIERNQQYLEDIIDFSWENINMEYDLIKNHFRFRDSKTNVLHPQMHTITNELEAVTLQMMLEAIIIIAKTSDSLRRDWNTFRSENPQRFANRKCMIADFYLHDPILLLRNPIFLSKIFLLC